MAEFLDCSWLVELKLRDPRDSTVGAPGVLCADAYPRKHCRPWPACTSADRTEKDAAAAVSCVWEPHFLSLRCPTIAEPGAPAVRARRGQTMNVSTAPPSLVTPPDRHGQRHSMGLHGHSLEVNMVRASTAEALGTFFLVLTIVSTVIAASLSKSVAGSPYGSLAVPVAGGLALAIVVASLGHVSGAHLNPAVTLGLAIHRRFPWAYVPAYLGAQLGGAVGAALVAWALYGEKARSVVNLGATYPAAGVPVWRALTVEAVVTFLLVLVVVSVATDRRVPAGVAAVAIGAALGAAILISGPISRSWSEPS